MGDLRLDIDAYVLGLGGVDIILGVAWLQSLGKVLMDSVEMSISFELNGVLVKLQSSGSSIATSVTSFGVSLNTASLLSVMKDSHHFLDGMLWNLSMNVVLNQHLSELQKGELQKVLDQYQGVFTELLGLPPHRGITHAITLLEGTSPISVRPYRYPHHQKNEIERQVQDMLAQGIIRHSSSPFSSPVILVKKKDASWRLCVDYRALNKAIVQDKFSIPVVDELMDELHGACYFSKLDLKLGYHQM